MMISKNTILLLGVLNAVALLAVAWLLRGSEPERARPSQKPPLPLVEMHEAPFPSQDFEISGSRVTAPENPQDGEQAAEPPPAAPAQQDLIPAAFVPPDPDDHFTPDDLATLDSLRKDFTDAVQAEHLSPQDPRYLQRWKELEAGLEEKYRTQFGDEAYVKYQGEASRMEAPR